MKGMRMEIKKLIRSYQKKGEMKMDIRKSIMQQAASKVIICAQIILQEFLEDDVVFNLKLRHTQDDLENFLRDDDLTNTHPDEISGIIWYEDGTWSEWLYNEISNRGRWFHREVPKIPIVLTQN